MIAAAPTTAKMTLGAALAAATQRLAAACVAEPRLDARILLGAAVDLAPEALLVERDRQLDDDAAARFDALLARRQRREPVARILGRREFWSLDFAVTPDVLDPRPDSETLIEAALEAVRQDYAEGCAASLRILDLGTGTGCLLLALLSELPAATGLGVDMSVAACAVARGNAESLGLAGRARFTVGDWGRGISENFNVILTNPPYISEEEFAGLEPEVAGYDPRSALAGGADGLNAYRALAPDLRRLLRPAGKAILEIGCRQAAPVGAILAAEGLSVARLRTDLAGRPRCLVAEPAERRKNSV